MINTLFVAAWPLALFCGLGLATALDSGIALGVATTQGITRISHIAHSNSRVAAIWVLQPQVLALRSLELRT
jgi:hypothetical protein